MKKCPSFSQIFYKGHLLVLFLKKHPSFLVSASKTAPQKMPTPKNAHRKAFFKPLFFGYLKDPKLFPITYHKGSFWGCFGAVFSGQFFRLVNEGYILQKCPLFCPKRGFKQPFSKKCSLKCHKGVGFRGRFKGHKPPPNNALPPEP